MLDTKKETWDDAALESKDQGTKLLKAFDEIVSQSGSGPNVTETLIVMKNIGPIFFT